jgi:hypothetical protein
MLKKVYAERGMVTEGWVSLDAADLGLVESVYKKNIREAEERLMLAVLESAVEDFQTHVFARSVRGRRLFQEAEDWFLDRDAGGIFSFESICDIPGLHPEPIRKGLMAWKEAKLKLSLVEPDRADRPKLVKSRVTRPPIRVSKTA